MVQTVRNLKVLRPTAQAVCFRFPQREQAMNSLNNLPFLRHHPTLNLGELPVSRRPGLNMP